MAIYLVGYDLKEGEDYSSLTTALRGFGTWWHCLDSTWLVESDLTALQVHARLWQHMKSGDRLLVLNYLQSDQGGSAAWQGFREHDPICESWLEEHL